MSDALYKYNPAAIEQGVEAIRGTHNRIDNALDQLEAYAQGQLANWSGDARASYGEHKRNWDQAVDNMKDIMVLKAVPALQRILENYNRTERLNVSSWQQG